MTTQFSMGIDVRGQVGYYLPFTDTKYSVTLTQGAAVSVTAPTDAFFYVMVVVGTPGAEIWVANDGNDAAAPSSGSPALTNSELNPGPRTVAQGSTISVLTTSTTANVGIQFYAVK